MNSPNLLEILGIQQKTIEELLEKQEQLLKEQTETNKKLDLIIELLEKQGTTSAHTFPISHEANSHEFNQFSNIPCEEHKQAGDPTYVEAPEPYNGTNYNN